MGLNPGPFTLQGSCTYLVTAPHGTSPWLIDTGEGSSAAVAVEEGARKYTYVDLLRRALEEDQWGVKGSSLGGILITHWHHDHTGGIQQVLGEFGRDIPVYKFPDPSHDSGKGPYREIRDGDVFRIGQGAGGEEDGCTTLRALHTPGHTRDHIALFLEEELALFTGDCVLGCGVTPVFTDLHAYMQSLERLVSGAEIYPRRLYPGHGEMMENGVEKIQEYLAHRRQREGEILRVLRDHEMKKQLHGMTIRDMVEIIYAAYPSHLHAPAAGSVLLHLLKLQKDGKVRRKDAQQRGQERYGPGGIRLDMVHEMVKEGWDREDKEAMVGKDKKRKGELVQEEDGDDAIVDQEEVMPSQARDSAYKSKDEWVLTGKHV
eukprot:Nk52_evm6s1671 gene=Nk52_evmTU6s1671